MGWKSGSWGTPVMKEWRDACFGVQRSSGFICSTPRRNCRKQRRLSCSSFRARGDCSFLNGMSSSICSSDFNSKYFLGVGSFLCSSRSYSSRVLSLQEVRAPRLQARHLRACWLHNASPTAPASFARSTRPPSLEPLARGSPWPSDEPSRGTSSSLLGARLLDETTSEVSAAVDIVDPALWPLSLAVRPSAPALWALPRELKAKRPPCCEPTTAWALLPLVASSETVACRAP
mmetsp:Transcript_73543/g.227155  ORF Transcript_73543/g.227155 Transcript_73543/m.227155 type:complete len:232 (+) Transcript_73543:1662-2357(+)